MSIESQKRCGKCFATKPISEFNRSLTAKNGLQCYCRVCQSVAVKERNCGRIGPRIFKKMRADYLKIGFISSTDAAKVLGRAYGRGFSKLMHGVRTKPFRVMGGKQLYYYCLDDVIRLKDKRAADAIERSSPIVKCIAKVRGNIVALSRSIEELTALIKGQGHQS